MGKLGFNRLYEKGRSTLGYIRGHKVEYQGDVSPGDLLIGVDHKNQKEFMVEVIPNPNPLNISLIHYVPVFTKESKRNGLQIKNVKNADPACVLVAELGFFEFWKAERRELAA